MIKLASARILLSFGILTTIIGLVYTLTLQGHSLIIGKLLSLEAVTIYAVPALLIRNVRAVLIAPARVFWPRFACLDGENRYKEIASLLIRGTRLTAIFASGIMLIIFVLGPSFIRLWVGEGFQSAHAVLLLLAGGYLIESSQAIMPHFLGGTGRQGMQAIFAAAEGTIGIGLSIILTWQLGLVGAPIGFLIGIVLIRGLICPWYICRLLNISFPRYYLSSLARPWLVLLALLLAAYYAELTNFVVGWLSLILVTLILCCLYAICAYFVALDSYARKKIKNLGRKSWNCLRLRCAAI